MSSASASPFGPFAERFLSSYPEDAAPVLDSLSAEEISAALERVSPSGAAEALEALMPDRAAAVLERLPRESLRALMPRVDPARAVVWVAQLDDSSRSRIVASVDRKLAKEIDELASYPPETAGHWMDPRVVALRSGKTVADALGRLRELGRGGVVEVFVVDRAGKLEGAVPVQALALADPALPLSSLLDREVARVSAMATREEVVEELDRQRLTVLPVIDFDGRLVGVIRYDALVTAAREEASVDVQTMVGAGSQERALSNVSFAVRKRLPWLQVNLVTAFLAASVVGVFEGTIARFTALAVLLPVVAGQSGNTGAQALAVTMRGLALREIRLRHWWAVSRKEVGVAFWNGIAVALTTSAGVYVWSGSVGLALVIGTSMILSMVAAGLAGAAIPLLLTAVKQDPAQSSSIILTTVTDVVGFFSFLGIATIFAEML